MTKSFNRVFNIAAVALIIDQITKYYVLHILDLPRIGRMSVFEGFNLSMAWNRGINFGIFASDDPNAQHILIAISVAISVILWIWAMRSSRLIQIGSGLIIGGALGNALDRGIYNGVADFLNITCCGVNNPYAFNVADVAIFMGAGVLMFFGGNSDAKLNQKVSGG